jgi:hypothetical protein
LLSFSFLEERMFNAKNENLRLNYRKLKNASAENCTKQPTFNFQEKTVGVRCAKHKLDGMIDVVHKKCSVKGCMSRPSYNFQGKTNGLRCAKHKLGGMIDVVHKRCSIGGCITIPTFNHKKSLSHPFSYISFSFIRKLKNIMTSQKH